MTVGQQSQWKPAFFGRIKSRLARPTLHRRCVLLQFIMAKNENVMGGREESHAWKCQLHSPWLFLTSPILLIRLPTLSPIIPQAPRQKGWEWLQVHRCVLSLKKKKLLESNYFSYFVNPSL